MISEAEYWDEFEREAAKHGIPFWVDYQKANTPEIGFINFSTDPEIDRIVLGKKKDFVIARVMQEKNTRKLLDLGCGAGWLCLELARRGCDVGGIDVSSVRIQTACAYGEKEGVHIDYRTEDLEHLKWAIEDGYDAILNWNSMHHVTDVDAVLTAVNTSLKNGGLFISWDHLGDNLLIKSATALACLIPGYYKQKNRHWEPSTANQKVLLRSE